MRLTIACPEVYRYLYAPPPEQAQMENRLAKAVASRFSEDGDTFYCASHCRTAANSLVKCCLNWPAARRYKEKSVISLTRFMPVKAMRQKPVHSVLERGFTEVGFHRIFARLDAANRGSIGVVERLGMRKEAHLRQKRSL
ncbi:Uncharacterised protein [Serratia fonticola]|uniref:N-acetyltransferase domain-containing protein n=1 Tax=Serratia fonticola TaxID=47917 RepID=A0A4U9UAH6_SERFO|nr:Uncharacterised protein [Serratia fonticola]